MILNIASKFWRHRQPDDFAIALWLEEGKLDYLKPMWYSFGLHNYEVTHLNWWQQVAGENFDRLILPVGMNQDELYDDPEANFPVVEMLRDHDNAGHFYFRWNHETQPDDWGERAAGDIYEEDARPYSHLTFSNDPPDPRARILLATSEDRVTRLYGLRNLLREHGYAVEVTEQFAGEPDAEVADDYDLVWFAREALPDDYEADWAELNVPLVVGTPFIARSWDWAEGEVTGDESTDFVVENPDHPIVAGADSEASSLAEDLGDTIQWRDRELSLYSVEQLVGGDPVLTQGDDDIAPALTVFERGELDDTDERRAFLNINFEVYLDWKNEQHDRDRFATNVDVLTDDGKEVVLRTVAWLLEPADEPDPDPNGDDETGPDADAGDADADTGAVADTQDASQTDGDTEPAGCGCAAAPGGTSLIAVLLAAAGLMAVRRPMKWVDGQRRAGP